MLFQVWNPSVRRNAVHRSLAASVSAASLAVVAALIAVRAATRVVQEQVVRQHASRVQQVPHLTVDVLSAKRNGV
jgi:hypothetical protein